MFQRNCLPFFFIFVTYCTNIQLYPVWSHFDQGFFSDLPISDELTKSYVSKPIHANSCCPIDQYTFVFNCLAYDWTVNDE